MKKCWLLEETDKKMIPMKDEWALAGNPPEPFHFDYMGWKESTILKLTEFSSNPLEPIKEVWRKYKDWYLPERFDPNCHDILPHELFMAISECMKMMEEK